MGAIGAQGWFNGERWKQYVKKMKIDNPTELEKSEAAKKAIEEHHSIPLTHGANNYK